MDSFDYQIFLNPLAGKGLAEEKLLELQKFLAIKGQTFRVIKVEGTVRLSELKMEKGVKINKALVCIGGDGTVSEAAGYLVNNQLKIPIFIIPCGTANFISGAVGVSPQVNYRRLIEGKIKKMDLGICEEGQKTYYFLLGIGLGFEQRFLESAKNYQRKIGKLSYYLAALVELFRLKVASYRLKIDGQAKEFKSPMMVALNLKPKITPLFPIFPELQIRPDDGQLDLVYLEHKNFLSSFLGILFFHLLGRVDFGLVKRVKAGVIEIQADESLPCQIDGEIKGQLPLKISIVPRRIQFLV
jgi:diacylglycerol kinase (ATP)